jgi:DNA-binding GntR family transcriptional regulator
MASTRPKLGTIGATHSSLHSRVTAALRKAIVSGKLKPGERLVEEKLAETFGVSRNPVREAIRVLASEGLVEVAARRGTFVARLDDTEARETIEVRAVLEAHNARLAARRQDPALLQRAQAVLDKGTAVLNSGRHDTLHALNVQFHQALAEAGHNRVLAELLQLLRERTSALFAPGEPTRQKQNWDEHAAILLAILEGEEAQAATEAYQHVMGAGTDYLDRLAHHQANSDDGDAAD